MSRYYFDVRENGHLFPDDEGLECDSLDAAERLAIEAAAEIGRDQLSKGDLQAVTVEVQNAYRQWVLTVTVSIELHRADPAPEL